jgi:energy-coupling factor transporter ATP-binding protein EcfA2
MRKHCPDITYLARTNYRGGGKLFGIKRADRLSHVYVIGKTGTGKSTLLETMIRQDIARGDGLAVIDPHGDLAKRVAAAVPPERADDLIFFAAPDPAQPYGYNPLTRVSERLRPLAASGLIETLQKQWDARAWGARMEHILRNATLALLELEHATLADLLRLLTDKRYRKEVIAKLENEQVRTFWQREYANYPFRYRAEAIAPIENKIGAYLADPNLRRMLTVPAKPLRLRRVMDHGQLLIVDLSKGEIGHDTANLLGGILVTSIGLAAFSRASVPAHQRRPFWLYVDEFQEFTTSSFANMVAELRKFGIGLVLAHQYLDQLEPDVRAAVIGNAATLISFRLGAQDAAFVARELAPRFEAVDLLNLPNHAIYLRLAIDGEPSRPFSAVTLGPCDTHERKLM